METIYQDTDTLWDGVVLCDGDDPLKAKNDEELSFHVLTYMLFHVGENVGKSFLLTFYRYSLPTCIDNLDSWYRQAMENEASVYGWDKARAVTLKALYRAVRKLVEALYLAYSPSDIEYSKNEYGEWSYQHGVPWDREKPFVLSKAEFRRPLDVIAGFRQRFGWEYVEMELWDWLVAALTNDSDENRLTENRSCLMDFYMHAHFMLEGVFYLSLPQPYPRR